MPFFLRRTTLAVAILAACSISPNLHARDLGNFDINVAALKQSSSSKSAAALARHGDAMGRETFTWVQQDLSSAAKAAARDPEAAARAHLTQLLSRAKRSTDMAQTLTPTKVDTQRGGATLVQFEPRIDRIEIFHEELALLLDAQQRLVAMRGPLPRNSPTSAKSLPTFKLDAAAAIAAALGAYDFEPNVAARLVPDAVVGDYRSFRLDRAMQSKSSAIAVQTQRAKPVYFRTQAGLQPAYYVETQIADAGRSVDFYAHVISALDGSVLFRVNQTAHATASTYRVWAEDPPSGLPYPSPQGRAHMPDPDGQPSNNAATTIPQQARTLANVPFSRSATDGWLPAGVTVTRGNNVNAYADLVEPDGFGSGDAQPTATSPNTFDYAFNPAVKPSTNVSQAQATTVQAFYWVNFLHDWFYDSGFTEADGNAQVDNFGRGGLGGDAIDAEAQDFDVRDNADMSTPADGASPRMQLGLTSGRTEVDIGLDGTTVAHEWGHYLSNRLIGDGSGLSTQHAGGLGEGWSDFVALLTLVKEEDKLKAGNATFGGAYPASSYWSNSYYGLRRYPYSTDPTKNPLSLRHLADGLQLPAPPPQFGGDGANNSEVHAQGEIWASALWDCYASLLNDSRLSFAEAQRRMKDYLIGGMKLTPVEPTMVEARDAILATILANGQTQDFALFTAAFAKRGLGAGAHIPDRYSETMVGTIESKDLGSDVAIAAASLGVASGCDADSALDVGESAQLRFTVANNGFTPLSAVTATLSSSDPALIFPNGTTVTVGELPLFGRREMTVPVKLNASVAPNSPITVTVTPDAPGVVTPPGAPGALTAFVNFDEAAHTTQTESFDGTNSTWQNLRAPVGEGSGSWTSRVEGNAKFLHGADTNIEAVTWTQTPILSVGSGPLTLTLKHRYAFESDEGEFYDGGVIQASIDGGRTWSDVDVGLLGAPLSSCCRNPFAGRKALVSRNTAYPAFSDQVIDLGTTYANQTNFRLRFGVATDAGVTRGGWDIDSVSFNGLTDAPFATVVAQAPTCSVANHKTLQGAMSGAYYLPSRSGEGVLVDVGEVSGTPVVFFSWYTYENGQQQWLVGNNTFSLSDKSAVLDLIETSGAGFGNAFRASDVIRSPWGSASLTFPDCDTLLVTYQKAGGEAGTLTLSRGLSRMDPSQCGVLHGGLTGAYYSTQRSGEGVVLDFGKAGNTPVEFLSWYTYENGQQRWLVGNQTFSPSDRTVNLDLIQTSGTGFGNDFQASDVVRTPWGRVTQRFIDCDTLELAYQKTGGESGTLVMTRGLRRLGDGQCH